MGSAGSFTGRHDGQFNQSRRYGPAAITAHRTTLRHEFVEIARAGAFCRRGVQSHCRAKEEESPPLGGLSACRMVAHHQECAWVRTTRALPHGSECPLASVPDCRARVFHRKTPRRLQQAVRNGDALYHRRVIAEQVILPDFVEREISPSSRISDTIRPEHSPGSIPTIQRHQPQMSRRSHYKILEHLHEPRMEAAGHGTHVRQ